MATAWDKFAEKNAANYILTGDTDYTTEEGKKHFFKSGEQFTQETLEHVLYLLPETERALEIGCGIGRLTLPHSKIFDHVVAVDISNVMLDRLNRNAAELKKDNISTFLPSGDWGRYSFDYAYSFIVFQHIKDFGIIENYIRRISSVLRPGGIAQLHFDTRSQNVFYKIRNLLPDIFLPKAQRKGIRRIRRRPERMKALFKKNGLEIIEELFPGSEQHRFILKKK